LISRMLSTGVHAGGLAAEKESLQNYISAYYVMQNMLTTRVASSMLSDIESFSVFCSDESAVAELATAASRRLSATAIGVLSSSGSGSVSVGILERRLEKGKR
jgi:hypothetical protein